MAELTFYPDAHVEVSSVDGHVQDATDDTWANKVADPGTAAEDTLDRFYIQVGCAITENIFTYIYRSIILFNTSDLPDTCIITAATLSLFGAVKADTMSCAPTLNVVSSAPASPTGLVGGDYDSLGNVNTNPFCDTPITYASFNMGTPGTANVFVFNAAGRAAISKDGITKLGLKLANYDYPGATQPNWVSDGYAYFRPWSADKGTTYRPKLVVTYTVVPTPVADGDLIGIGVIRKT